MPDLEEYFRNVQLSRLFKRLGAGKPKIRSIIKTVLKKNGKAAVLDMFEHDFEEFKAEMGDIHLGFKPESIYEMARKQFAKVKVEKVSGIRCECSGRSTEIFIAKMQGSPR